MGPSSHESLWGNEVKGFTSPIHSAVLAALELCEGRCCDDGADRHAIADRIARTLRNQQAALVVREMFRDAHGHGERMEIVASHGARLGALIDAACWLAGMEVER